MISIIIISYLLDGMFLNSIDLDSVLCPLFSMLSLVVVYPFCKDNHKKYLITCGLVGFFYDIVYGNLFLNVFLFLLIGLCCRKMFKYLAINVINTYVVGIIMIFVYRIMNCLFYIVFGFSDWSISILINSITSSIILNSIYLFTFYFIVKKMRKYLRKRKYSLLKVEKQ